jgi:hypothetical protein
MNGSFLAEKKLHARIANGRITTHSGRSPIMATTGIAPLQSIESAMTTR